MKYNNVERGAETVIDQPLNKSKIRFALAFIVPATLSVVWYLAMRFYPIENVVLYTSDLSQQYRAFLSYYQDWLHGKVSMQYSWDLFSGSNMIGNFAYYTGSIFNLLLFFFPKKYLYEAICIILLLKIACSGGAMYAYLDFTMKKQKQFVLIFSTSFAFCGMLVGYFFNIIWLDAFIYLPLSALGLKQMMKTKKMSKLFVISLSLLLIANFYMAYMVGGLIFLLFLGMLWETGQRKERMRAIGCFFGMTALSLGLAAVVILPTLLQLQLASKSGVTFSNVWFNPVEALGKLFNGVYYPESYIDTSGAIAPHIYSGLLVVLLVIPFFLLKKISFQKKIIYGSILAFLSLSLLWEPLGIAWQGFNQPTGYPFRFAFLFSFILIDLAAQSMDQLTKSTKPLVWFGFSGMSILWLIISLVIPSIGIGLWWWNQLLLIIISTVLVFYLDGQYNQITGILLIFICVTEVSTNSILSTKKMEQVNKFNTYEARSYSANQDVILEDALNQLQKTDPTTINRAKSNYHSFLNDNLFYGFPSIGGFSSLKSSAYGEMMRNLGYEASRVSVRTGSGTQISNDLFNVTTNIIANYRLDKTASEVKQYQKDDLSIFEQPYKVSTGIVVDERKLEDHFNADAQEKIIQLFNGKSETILTKESVQNVSELGVTKQNRNYVQTSSSAKLVYTLPEISEDEDLYVYFGSPYSVEGMSYSLSMRRGLSVQNGWHFVEKGAKTLTINWDQQQQFPEYGIQFMKINTTEWSKLMKKNEGQGLKLDQLGTKSFEGTVPINEKKNKALLLTIPYDKGWNYKINGKKVEATQVFDNLTSLKLPKTSKKIKIEGNYTSPGLRLGQMITILTILSCLGYEIFSRLQKKQAIKNFREEGEE